MFGVPGLGYASLSHFQHYAASSNVRNMGAEIILVLWFHTPYMIMVYGTSNEPQNFIGNYLGPCSSVAVP